VSRTSARGSREGGRLPAWQPFLHRRSRAERGRAGGGCEVGRRERDGWGLGVGGDKKIEWAQFVWMNERFKGK
jgi:hypothetical protein